MASTSEITGGIPSEVKWRIWSSWFLAGLFVVSIVAVRGRSELLITWVSFTLFVLVTLGIQRPRISLGLERILNNFWIWVVGIVTLTEAHCFSFLTNHGMELLVASTLGFMGVWIYRDIYFLRSGSMKSNSAGRELYPPPVASISPVLEKLRNECGVPALGVAVTNGAGRLDWVAVSGVRRSDSDAKVTVSDKFHLGSCGKSMTATVAALLVDQGLLEWKLTLGEFFSEIKVHPEYAPVTLEQLLCHRGGVPDDLKADGLWASLWKLTGTPTEQRAYLVEQILTKPPARRPGSEYLYSNAGFTIAGAMMEQLLKEPWESCVQSRLFQPLNMSSAGFGAPARPDTTDQPLGHLPKPMKSSQPVEPGLINADNPVSLAPAGTVHCSLVDWARYASFHLSGQSSDGALRLSPATLHKLHTPECDPNYAFGWIVTSRPWSFGNVLTHGGSNTMFYAVIWLAPERDFAVMAVTNKGGDEAFQACDRVISKVIHG